jgi:hypothetical protein
VSLWHQRKNRENPAYPDGGPHIDQPLQLLWAFSAIADYYRDEEGGQ